MIDVLKRSVGIKTIEDKYRYIAVERSRLSVDKLCCLLDLSRIGYYAWTARGQSRRAANNQVLLRERSRLQQRYPALGLDGLYHLVKRSFICSKGRLHRLMKTNSIHSQRKRAYKATTNSKHSYPVAPNLLKRSFAADRSNAVPGWRHRLYPYGPGLTLSRRCKGFMLQEGGWFAFTHRIDAQLATQALEMAVCREKPADALVFHSDRGVQYASLSLTDRCWNDFPFGGVCHARGILMITPLLKISSVASNVDRFTFAAFPLAMKPKPLFFVYIEAFYNRLRPHSGIGWFAPADFASSFLSNSAAQVRQCGHETLKREIIEKMQRKKVFSMEAYRRQDIIDGVWELLAPHLPGQVGQWGRDS